jgi:Zn-dependent protease
VISGALTGATKTDIIPGDPVIIQYLQGRYNTTDLIIVAIIMIFALVFHNVTQAWVASRYGDANPRFSGFMSFDFQRHLEPMGVLFLFLLGFGWPRQIPTNSRNYRGRGKQEAWVWYSGPLAYLLIAFVSSLAAAIFASVGSPILARSFIFASSTAILHAVINLFPVFPLDGAKAALAWGNPDVRRFIQQIASFGILGFILVFFVLGALGVTSTLQGFFQGAILSFIRLIPGL